jgi:esterase/lipase
MAAKAISTCFVDIKMELESMADANETMGRELEEMRQSIDQAQTCLDTFIIEMKVYQAATKAMIAEKAARRIYKKKAGGGVDWICVNHVK